MNLIEAQTLLEQILSGSEPVSLATLRKLLNTDLVRSVEHELGAVFGGFVRLGKETKKQQAATPPARKTQVVSAARLQPEGVAARRHVLSYLKEHGSSRRADVIAAYSKQKTRAYWGSIFQSLCLAGNIKPNGKNSLAARWTLTSTGEQSLNALPVSLRVA